MFRWFVLQFALLFVPSTRPEEVFNTTPPPLRTSFSCLGRATGFYADVEANCRVYHTCDDYGNKFSYRCPEETAFRQDALICDHAHLVDCQATRYPGQRPGNEKRENSPPSRDLTAPDDPGDDRRSYSRSFQVIQRPNKSASSDKPGFVFSASVFLRDLDEPASRELQPPLPDEPVGRTLPKTGHACNVNGMHEKERHIYTTVPSFNPTQSKLTNEQRVNAQKVFTGRQGGSKARDKVQSVETSNYKDAAQQHRLLDSRKEGVPKFDTFGKDPTVRNEFPTSTASYQTASRNFASADFQRASQNNRDYPYLETLRSIQANARSSTPPIGTTTSPGTTTEMPVHALTLSLKPLVPNELEYDPYYPRLPTSTEAYYTPSNGRGKANFRTSTQPPRSSVRFEIPAVLPDLNTLEDLVDRRKLFYIPRVKST